MSTRMVGRREVLLGAGAAAGGVALVGAAATPALADQQDGGRGVLGTWFVTRQDDPAAQNPPVQALLSFAAGGVFLEQDLAPAGPSGQGAWASRNHGGYSATFWLHSPPENGSPAASVLVRIHGYAWDDHIAGKYTFTVYLAGTTTQVDAGTGSFTGSRVRA